MSGMERLIAATEADAALRQTLAGIHSNSSSGRTVP